MSLRFARDEWLFFRTSARTDGSRVAMSFKGDGDLDTVIELTRAVDDLSNALDGSSVSGIEEKQMRNLIASSVADTYEIAKTEWKLKKQWADSDGQCELCGQNPIVYHFQIENKLNHNKMILGSSCILSYVTLQGFTRDELRLYLDRLRARLQDRRFDSVDHATLDIWDKQDAVFASLKILMSDIPDGFDIAEYARQIGSFRKVAGYKLPDAFAKWVRNITVMQRVMENTYRTTKLSDIPDKIRRKQKVNGKKIEDAEKLKMFIEFETQLQLLMQYGTPTESYDMILNEYRRFLSQQTDALETKQLAVDSGIVKYFNVMKQNVGNRSRLKDYIDTWKDAVLLSVEQAFSKYSDQLKDIEQMLAGARLYFSPPSEDVDSYIRNWVYSSWQAQNPGHLRLYNLLLTTAWTYVPTHGYGSRIPADHPIRSVTSISSVDLKAAILSCLDAGEIRIDGITASGIQDSRGTCMVSSEALIGNADLMKRLMGDSDAFRQAIEDAKGAADDAAREKAKAEAEAEQLRIQEEKNYSDMLADAVKFTDTSDSREVQFVEDMQSRYKRVSELSPAQLRWIRGIANRSAAPVSSTVPAPSNGSLTKVPSNGKMSLTDFLTACQETMRVGREDGFIADIIKRTRVRNWDDLTPRQQKWLTDIFTRGGKRDMPDNITHR